MKTKEKEPDQFTDRKFVPGPNPACNCEWCVKILRGEIKTDATGRFIRKGEEKTCAEH
jgi:hypothetical protein